VTEKEPTNLNYEHVAEFTDEQLIQSIFNPEKSQVAEEDETEEPKSYTWKQALLISKPAAYAESRAMTLQQK
jgi:RNA polymerase subunit RPABC4/transcription elongation factor Spt4